MRHYYSSLQMTHIQIKKNIKIALKRPHIERSVGADRQKCKKHAEKIQDIRLNQKFATSERKKKQEKRQFIQVFRDNFFRLGKNSKPFKVLLDIP